MRSIDGRHPSRYFSGWRGARRPYAFFCERPWGFWNRYCFGPGFGGGWGGGFGFRNDWFWCRRPWFGSRFSWINTSFAFCWDNPWRYTYGGFVDPWCPGFAVNPFYFAPTSYLAFASSLPDVDATPDASDVARPSTIDAPVAAPIADAPMPRRDATSEETLAVYYVELADLYFETGRYTRAAASYARAIRLMPEDASLRLAHADAWMAIGDYDKAAYSLRMGLSLDPELAGSELDKRESYGAAGDLDKHIEAMRARLRTRNFDTNARLCLFWTLRFSGEIDVAKAELATLREQLPGDSIVSILESRLPAKIDSLKRARGV